MTFEDEDRGPLFLGIFSTGTVVAILVTLLRFWVRVRIVRKIGADDWIMLSSLVKPCPVVYIFLQSDLEANGTSSSTTR